MLRDLPARRRQGPSLEVPLLDRQQAFGYTQEDIRLLMQPMAQTGQEAVGSMGTDTPISALSDRPKLLDTSFQAELRPGHQPADRSDPRGAGDVARVPSSGRVPICSISRAPSRHMRLQVSQPILNNEELERIRQIGKVSSNPFRTVTIDITYDVANGPDYMEAALEAICAGAERAVRDGYNIIILSDRAVSADRVPIPSLLATSATIII